MVYEYVLIGDEVSRKYGQEAKKMFFYIVRLFLVIFSSILSGRTYVPGMQTSTSILNYFY
jgi:hypothetical protein